MSFLIANGKQKALEVSKSSKTWSSFSLCFIVIMRRYVPEVLITTRVESEVYC